MLLFIFIFVYLRHALSSDKLLYYVCVYVFLFNYVCYVFFLFPFHFVATGFVLLNKDIRSGVNYSIY